MAKNGFLPQRSFYTAYFGYFENTIHRRLPVGPVTSLLAVTTSSKGSAYIRSFISSTLRGSAVLGKRTTRQGNGFSQKGGFSDFTGDKLH
ncbi:hypothetical protein [Cyclobacterium xiamenense]|uniref:hypothetical protein n=1 Tax=Cyclobacterium xiamenense TaxID=1297121 RepID=UPI0035CF0CF7